ncbi:MAG: septum formation initiator family protein [Lachnospiraceae bacterium]
MTNKTQKKKRRTGRLSISIIVILLLTVMSIQIFNLYKKNQVYTDRLEALSLQLEEETERAEEIEAYEAYSQSKENKEDIARSKLGLIYPNEIIFKEEE